jgi:hypothetical protein
MPQNFEVNTSDYLGFEYEEYLNKLMALAMSRPAEYYDIRSKTLAALKKVVVENIYTEYYKLLTSQPLTGSNPALTPNYPQQKASQFALAASKTINEILNSALDIILPANHLDVAKLKLTERGNVTKFE